MYKYILVIEKYLSVIKNQKEDTHAFHVQGLIVGLVLCDCCFPQKTKVSHEEKEIIEYPVVGWLTNLLAQI